MKLVIGSDHGAVELKEEIKDLLKAEFSDVEVEDMGTFGKESVDYPDIAEKVCTPVAKGEADPRHRSLWNRYWYFYCSQ